MVVSAWKRHRVWAGGILLLTTLFAACSGGSAPSSATSTSAPTATATATTLAHGVIYQSSLKAPLTGWMDDSNLRPESDGYHIIGGYFTMAPITPPADTTVTVTMKQVAGGSGAFCGIVFRETYKNRYEFDIDANGEWYALKDVNAVHTDLVDPQPNAAIHQGVGASNVLEVSMQGSHFAFFVNGTQVGAADDTAHPSGQVGLAGDDGTEVVFTDFTVAQPT